jgi:hypothetical protein
MDKIKGQVRQGDVLLDPTSTPLATAVPVPRDAGRVILAYGEVTGHAHALTDEGVALMENPATGERQLVAKADSMVRHEEHAALPVLGSLTTETRRNVILQAEWDDEQELGFGVADLTGNAFEWVADVYDPAAYAGRDGRITPSPFIRQATNATASPDHVLRGGSFVLDGMYLRNSFRMRQRPSVRTDDFGFRVVRESAPDTEGTTSCESRPG